MTNIITTDVAVFGAGPAGCAAAIASARMGASTVLIERHGFCGGMGTAAGLSAFINYRDGGTDLSAPVYREVIRELGAMGAHYRSTDLHSDFFEPEALKLVLDRMLSQAGVRVLYHCEPDTVFAREHGFWRVLCRGNSGVLTIRAKCLADCTGDAEVCHLAGVKTDVGRRTDARMQPMSMVLRMGGFDPDSYRKSGGELIDDRYVFEGSCRQVEIRRAREAGMWDIPREDLAMFWSHPWAPTIVTANCTRVQGNAINTVSLSEAEALGRQQAWQALEFFRNFIPGFANAFMISTGPQIGVRETRRILGRNTLTAEDVLSGRIGEDSIAQCAYPIDVHSPTGVQDIFDLSEATRYGIPYGCLLPDGVDWILAAGRCISASHEAAGSFRVMPTCFSLGQAAGTAAALAVRGGRSPCEITAREVLAAYTPADEFSAVSRSPR